LKKKHINKLGRNSKIKKASSIYSLYKTGSEWKCPYFKIYYYPNKLKNSRLGIIISKESGKSFFRNKFKRAVREIFRTKILKLELHFDVLIKNCYKNDFSEKKQIDEALYTWCSTLKK
jgi:ribonuclease P protein component